MENSSTLSKNSSSSSSSSNKKTTLWSSIVKPKVVANKMIYPLVSAESHTAITTTTTTTTAMDGPFLPSQQQQQQQHPHSHLYYNSNNNNNNNNNNSNIQYSNFSGMRNGDLDQDIHQSMPLNGTDNKRKKKKQKQRQKQNQKKDNPWKSKMSFSEVVQKSKQEFILDNPMELSSNDHTTTTTTNNNNNIDNNNNNNTTTTSNGHGSSVTSSSVPFDSLSPVSIPNIATATPSLSVVSSIRTVPLHESNHPPTFNGNDTPRSNPKKNADKKKKKKSKDHKNNNITTNTSNSNKHKEELKKPELSEKELTKIQERKKALTRLYKRKPYPQVYVTIRGISNRSVDCYLNAVLQALLSLPKLVDCFAWMESAHAQEIGPVTFGLKTIVDRFAVKTTSQVHFGGTVAHPIPLLDVLKIFHDVAGEGQQDAQEFLHWIIERLHSEWTIDFELEGYTLSKEQQEMEKEKEKEERQWKVVGANVHHRAKTQNDVKMELSLMRELFGGRLYTILLVDSDRKGSVSYQPFFTLSLNISDENVTHIKHALESTLKKHSVTGIQRGDYKHSGDRQCKFAELPHYLVLHLKRFLYIDGRPIKISKHIRFETRLNISKNLLLDHAIKGHAIQSKEHYKLRSVIIHKGYEVSHGHYECWCLRPHTPISSSSTGINDKLERKPSWICFDDTKVKIMDTETMQQQQAYLLLYEKHG